MRVTSDTGYTISIAVRNRARTILVVTRFDRRDSMIYYSLVTVAQAKIFLGGGPK